MYPAISHEEDKKAACMLYRKADTLHLIPFILALFPNSRELFRFFLVNPNKYNYMNLQAIQVIEANTP